MSLSTRRVPTRSNRRASSTASSSLSAALVADCDSATRSAAADVLPASATAVKMASWRKVMRIRSLYLFFRLIQRNQSVSRIDDLFRLRGARQFQGAGGFSRVSSTSRSASRRAYFPAARSGRKIRFQLDFETTLGSTTKS